MSEFEKELRELAKKDIGLAIKHMADTLDPNQTFFIGDGGVFVCCSTLNEEADMSEMLEDARDVLNNAQQMHEAHIEQMEEEL